MLVTGCEDKPAKSEVATKTEKKVENQVVTVSPLPFTEDDYKFESSFGWLNDDTIIYTVQEDQRYHVFSFHIPSQRKEKIYSTNEIISEASISPNKKYILIYSASESSKANIKIISSDGKELYSVSIPSAEIDYSWSQYSDDVLLIDSFYEDWTHTSYVANFSKGSLEEVKLSKPFAQWSSKDSVMYLEWDEESPQLSAPIMEYDLKTKDTKKIKNDVISFNKRKDVFLSIHEQKDNNSEIEYQFFDKKGKKLKSLRSPVIGSYSGWIIPAFDLTPLNKTITTFLPYESAIVDQYDQNFKLIRFNWETGKTQVLKEDVESAPISCSSNGKRCLYGNALENLIEI